MQKQLIETTERFRIALLTNDVPVMESILAEDYVGFDPCGNEQDRKLSIEAYQPGCVELETFEVEDVEVEVVGEVGVVTGKGYIHGTFAGCEFEHRLRFMDVYVWRDGRWQLFRSQVTPLGSS